MKILIVYASAGAGHRKAAEAVYEAISEKVDKKDIVIIDSLDYSNRLFKWLYSKKYITLVNYMPVIWGFFYYILDMKIVYSLVRPLRRMINALNCWRLEEFLCNLQPEVVISCHFMANEVVSHLKEAGRLNCKLFSVVTDYRLHSFWVTPLVDFYFVAMGRTRADLLKWRVPDNKIYITGVPISPKFSLALDRKKTRFKLGLAIDSFVILMIGGGFGVGPVESLVRSIGAVSKNIQLLVVCGWNRELCEKVNKAVLKQNIKAKVYGFVNNVDELMSVSDLLITKSGGLTSSEALAKNLAAIFIKPIPGQEKRNGVVLEAEGAAFIAYDVAGVRKKVKELMDKPNILKAMSDSIKALAKPNSARDIADLVMRFSQS